MRLDYIPANAIAPTDLGGGSRYIASMWLYDDPNSYNPSSITDPDFLNRKNCKFLDPKRPWHHYVNCRPLSAIQNVPWQDTATYSSTAFNTLTKATTMIRIKGIGGSQPSGLALGYLTVTYYIVFKI